MKKVALELAHRDFIVVAQAVVEYAKRESKRKIRNERDSEKAMRVADLFTLRNKLLEIYQTLPKNE